MSATNNLNEVGLGTVHYRNDDQIHARHHAQSNIEAIVEFIGVNLLLTKIARCYVTLLHRFVDKEKSNQSDNKNVIDLHSNSQCSVSGGNEQSTQTGYNEESRHNLP